MEYEKAVTPREIADTFGLSYAKVQEFCRREVNPCPHINISEKRGYYRIVPSRFYAWLLKGDQD